MEDWLKNAKDRAKEEAEMNVNCIADLADEYDLDFDWFFEEVVKEMRKLKVSSVDGEGRYEQ